MERHGEADAALVSIDDLHRLEAADQLSALQRTQRQEALTQAQAVMVHRLLCPDSPHLGLYPVFAFTPDLFQRLQEEDYHLPEFDRNYAQA